MSSAAHAPREIRHRDMEQRRRYQERADHATGVNGPLPPWEIRGFTAGD